MGLFQDVEQKVELWALKKALPGAVQAGVAFLVGHLASSNVIPLLGAYGITVDPTKLGASLVALSGGAGVTVVAHVVLDWITSHLFKQSAPPAAAPADAGTPGK